MSSEALQASLPITPVPGTQTEQNEKNADEKTWQETDLDAERVPEKTELDKVSRLTALGQTVQTPILRSYKSELAITPDIRNDPSNDSTSFKIDTGVTKPKAVATAAVKTGSEPSCKPSGSMPNSEPSIPLLSFAPQESKSPKLQPQHPKTSFSSPIPIFTANGKDQVWQHLNPNFSALLCTDVQVAPATLPGYNIQHITKKYSVSKHHQKNMGDNNKREPEQQHQIKLGVTHATDSSEKQKNYQGLPKLQTLLPEPQSLLAPSPAQSISLHECQPSPILRKLGIRPQSQATLLTEEIRKAINRCSLRELKTIFVTSALSGEQIQHLLRTEKAGRCRKRMLNFLSKKMCDATKTNNKHHSGTESAKSSDSTFPRGTLGAKATRARASSKATTTTHTSDVIEQSTAARKPTTVGNRSTTVGNLSPDEIEHLVHKRILSAEQAQKMFVDEKNALSRKCVLELLATSIRDCCARKNNALCIIPGPDSNRRAKSQSSDDQNVAPDISFSESSRNNSSEGTLSEGNHSESHSSETNCTSDDDFVDPGLKTAQIPSATSSSELDCQMLPTSKMLSLKSQSVTLQTSLRTTIRKLSVDKMRIILKNSLLSREQLQHLICEEHNGRSRKLMLHLLNSRINTAPNEQNEKKDVDVKQTLRLGEASANPAGPEKYVDQRVKLEAHVGQNVETVHIGHSMSTELKKSKPEPNLNATSAAFKKFADTDIGYAKFSTANSAISDDTDTLSTTTLLLDGTNEHVDESLGRHLYGAVDTNMSTFSQQTMQTIQELIKERSFAETRDWRIQEDKKSSSKKKAHKRGRKVSNLEDTRPARKKR